MSIRSVALIEVNPDEMEEEDWAYLDTLARTMNAPWIARRPGQLPDWPPAVVGENIYLDMRGVVGIPKGLADTGQTAILLKYHEKDGVREAWAAPTDRTGLPMGMVIAVDPDRITCYWVKPSELPDDKPSSKNVKWSKGKWVNKERQD